MASSRQASTAGRTRSRGSPLATSALLLHGEEQFLVKEEAAATLAAWKEHLVSDFGIDVLEPAGLTVPRLRESITQSPFLDPYRVVSVRGVLSNRADALAPAMEQVPDSTRLLLTVNGRLAQGSKLAKAVAALPGGQVKEHSRLRGRRLQDWAQDRARRLKLSGAVAAAVVRASPPDLGVIDSELRKLAAYTETGSPLDEGALRELLAGGREEEIFRLTDNLLPRPTAGAWAVARNLVESGVGPTLIAYRLARHLSMVLEVKTRQERGEGLPEVQAAMRDHPFVVQKAFDAAQSASAERLEAALNAILAYEWEVKSGQVDAGLGLEVLLSKL
jgi:DNA polymerase III delta subunit